MEKKPKLLMILIKDTETNSIICSFPPTEMGRKRANRFLGLTNIEIVEKYMEDNHYESN